MKSHDAQFSGRDLALFAGGPLLAAALLALVAQLAAAAGWLPAPRPTTDTDRTILLHQADAARTAPATDVVLIGDSSCLMDVSARELATHLGRTTLNLGTISHLDLPAYGLLLRELTRRHPPGAVVVLLHPEALRRLGAEPHPLAVLTNYLAGRDDHRAGTLTDRFQQYAAVEILTGRLLARAVPSPLPGAYGAFYGFSDDLERFMTREGGSAIDPGRERFTGNAEYRLAPTLARASQTFRASLPASSRLIVGITPVPAGFAPAGFAGQRDALLRQWGEWLGATALLTNLPATLPDDRFARVTHLRPEAVPDYTRELGRALQPFLPPLPPPGGAPRPAAP